MPALATRDGTGRRSSRRRRVRASDHELVERFRGGDDAAFEAIYERYHVPLLAFCRHLLGDREDAADALQQAYAAAYKSIPATGDEMLLKPWLFTVARNRCVSAHRARRNQVPDDALDAEPSLDGLSAQVQ